MRIVNYYFSLLFLLLVQYSYAQKFYVQVASNSIDINQSIEVNFVAQDINSDKIVLPVYRDFNVVGGPNISQSTSIVNTTMTQSYTWSFYLQPKHTGVCTIEQATLLTNKGKLFTNPVSIQVSGIAQNNLQSIVNQNPVVENSNFFIKVVPNKKSVFVGENLMITYKLFLDEAIEGGSFLTDFNNSNFSTVDVFNKKEDQVVANEMVGNKPYKSVVIEKILINATKVGVHKIAPIKFNLRVKRKGSSIFDQFLGQEFEDILIQSEAINIEVKDLPYPRPTSYCHAVGNFSIACHLNKIKANTDEPISLKIDITGSGSMKQMTAPDIELPLSFEKYDPQRSENLGYKYNEQSGVVSYEYIFTPHEPGKYSVASPIFTYFNPLTGAFSSISCDSFQFSVSGNATPYVRQAKSTIIKDSALYTIQKDFGTVLPAKNLGNADWIYYFLLSMPLMILSFTQVADYSKNKRLQSDYSGVAYDEVLRTIKELDNSSDVKVVCKECNRLLFAYLSSKYNTQNLSRVERIDELLISRGVKPSLVKQITHYMQGNEEKIYSPYELSGWKQESLQQLRQIIEELK